MQRLILIVLSAFFFLASPAVAKDSAGKWIVSQRSGDVRVVHRGLQPASVKANTTLSPGDVVMTGATGRATLARGADYIVVAPRSELRLPAEAQPGGFTRVVQRLGTMLFKVKHTGVPHFAVDTPMLAAVVKGTTFTVIVDKDRSAVQVIEGAVQVVATDGGMQKLVEGGNTVFIDRNNPKQLLFATPQTLGPVGAASGTAVRITGSGDESVSEIASLTTGLVRAEPVPAPAPAPTVLALLVNASAPLAGTGTVNSDPAAQNPAPTSPGGGVPPTTTTVDPLVAPVANTVVAPVVGSVAPIASAVAPIVAPITSVVAPITSVVAPIVAPVTSVVAPIVAPVTSVVAPIVAPVTSVVAPIVAPIAPVVAPIVAPIAPVVAPIVAPIAPVIAPIVAPIAPIVAPIAPVVAPIVAPIAPIVAPIAPVIAPIVAPIAPIVVPIIPIPPLFGP